MKERNNTNLRVGLGGLGAVGMPIAKWLNKGVEGLELVAISANNVTISKSTAKLCGAHPNNLGEM